MSGPLVGSRITFGHFPQGGNGEILPIEWRVVVVNGDQQLLICEKTLCFMPYNGVELNLTWRDSPLRKWLNGDFLHRAFSPAEWQQITPAQVRTEQEPDAQITYSDQREPDLEDVPGGNVTNDRVFLLSRGEVNAYLLSEDDRLAFPTEYALSQVLDVREETNYTVDWWLRRALVVQEDGSINPFGLFPSTDCVGVRPALWLNSQSGGVRPEGEVAREAERRQAYAVGSQVFFGRYPTRSVITPIAWRVQQAEGNGRLLVCENALETKPFNEKDMPVTWETCTLRKWLNVNFLLKAFNLEERAHIALTRVYTSNNAYDHTSGGIETEDRVFLLSYKEIQSYAQAGAFRSLVDPTNFAYSHGKPFDEHGMDLSGWWLRSPAGRQGSFIVHCYHAGQRSDSDSTCFGCSVPIPDTVEVPCSDLNGVRPALWLILSD